MYECMRVRILRKKYAGLRWFEMQREQKNKTNQKTKNHHGTTNQDIINFNFT